MKARELIERFRNERPTSRAQRNFQRTAGGLKATWWQLEGAEDTIESEGESALRPVSVLHTRTAPLPQRPMGGFGASADDEERIGRTAGSGHRRQLQNHDSDISHDKYRDIASDISGANIMERSNVKGRGVGGYSPKRSVPRNAESEASDDDSFGRPISPSRHASHGRGVRGFSSENYDDGGLGQLADRGMHVGGGLKTIEVDPRGRIGHGEARGTKPSSVVDDLVFGDVARLQVSTLFTIKGSLLRNCPRSSFCVLQIFFCLHL